jgi:signal transduction histidine kinase
VVALVLSQAFAVAVKFRVLAAGLDVGWFSWPLDATYFAAAWFLGYSLRRGAAYSLALEQSREELAARAVDHERTRIARELHDSIGHAITAMVVHAGVVEQTIDRRPDDARCATETIGDIGRSALGDMDRLLGLLRDDDAEAEILRPSLANLAGLVSEFESCGLDVAVELDERCSELPRDVDQSAFRIVQEALTNVLKHAGPTHVDVQIAADGDGVDIRVHDDGPRSPRQQRVLAAREGHGLLGMRERAAIHQGDVEAGPCADGYLVTAHLPVGDGAVS